MKKYKIQKKNYLTQLILLATFLFLKKKTSYLNKVIPILRLVEYLNSSMFISKQIIKKK